MILQRLARHRVERRKRLIQQQHLGLHDQRARERHPLLLAAAQITRQLGALGCQADAGEDSVNAQVARFRGRGSKPEARSRRSALR